MTNRYYFQLQKYLIYFFPSTYQKLLGDFVKVYLYILFLSKYGKDIKMNDLAKKLSLPFPIIQEALKYWEDLGVITKKGNNGFIINNLQEIELHKLYKPNISLSIEAIERNEKNETKARVIETINNTYFQGVMSPSWYADIDILFNQYEFDEQVVIALFNYCFQRSALHQAYLRKVAEGWAGSNVKTFRDLEVYFQKQQAEQIIEKSIQKKLGLPRPLTEYEKGYVQKWSSDFGYSLDIIEIALKKTTSKTNISFDYLDKTITDWHSKNLKTADDIQNYQIAYKAQMKKNKEAENKIKYNNFEQRSYNNFDNLYANKQS